MSDEAEAAPAPKKKGKTLIFAAAGAVVLLIVVGVGAAFALGLFGGDADAAAEHHEAEAAAHGADSHASDHAPVQHAAADSHAPAKAHGGSHRGEPVFVELPQMLVNLVVMEGRPRFLKLSLAVEVEDQGVAERIKQLSPRIVDSFQLYLRTLTPAELQGPGSMFRLKEDLHVRIHQAIEPDRVHDVLFKEMLVQ